MNNNGSSEEETLCQILWCVLCWGRGVTNHEIFIQLGINSSRKRRTPLNKSSFLVLLEASICWINTRIFSRKSKFSLVRYERVHRANFYYLLIGRRNKRIQTKTRKTFLVLHVTYKYISVYIETCMNTTEELSLSLRLFRLRMKRSHFFH